MKRILVSCLENSANLHFEQIYNSLGTKNYEFVGIFDKKFGSPLYDSKEFSAMGFVEILPLIFKAKKAMNEMLKLARNCDKILLIDSPAFNLPFAKKLKENKINAEITYYILPQVWAWKQGRVAKVEAYCDNLASILPFDSQFYSRAAYVGHPLLDEIKFQKKDYAKNGILAFLPGSRKAEILRLMPVFRELAKNFKNERKILVVPQNLMSNLSEIYGDTSGFKISNDTPQTLFKSDFAFICSGTATLEAALIGTPFVLAYKAKSIDIFIAKMFVKIAHAGLANIMFDFMGKEPLNVELLQNDANAKNLMLAYQNADFSRFEKGAKILREYLKYGSAKNVAKILS